MAYRVTLMTSDSQARPTLARIVGEFADKRAAFSAAKKAAGRGARWWRKGISYGYAGPHGAAWITD